VTFISFSKCETLENFIKPRHPKEGENKEEKGKDSRPSQKTETRNQGPKKEVW
jgi:hypothetical protein